MEVTGPARGSAGGELYRCRGDRKDRYRGNRRDEGRCKGREPAAGGPWEAAGGPWEEAP